MRDLETLAVNSACAKRMWRNSGLRFCWVLVRAPFGFAISPAQRGEPGLSSPQGSAFAGMTLGDGVGNMDAGVER